MSSEGYCLSLVWHLMSATVSLHIFRFSCNIAHIMTTENTNKDFAVIATGGKQYVVSAGDVLDVELLGDYKAGDTIEFTEVLMQNDKVGTPTVVGAKVTATYVELKKGIKLSIVRFKAKSNRDRKLGHRQKYSRVRIESVA